MKRRTRWLAGFSAVLLALGVAATASGYEGQVKASISIRATVTCGGPFTATATVLDADGAPVVGQSVAWSFVTKADASDTIDRTPTVTNSHGVATTTLTLAAVSGTRRVRATINEGTADEVGATAVLTSTCGDLPRTSTLPAESPARPEAPLTALLLVALASAIGGGLTLRRLATTHR